MKRFTIKLETICKWCYNFSIAKIEAQIRQVNTELAGVGCIYEASLPNMFFRHKKCVGQWRISVGLSTQVGVLSNDCVLYMSVC